MQQYDKFGIPTKFFLTTLPLAEHNKPESRLEKIIGRKLTETELSAAESMASEHASYGSSRFYLKTLLPTNGPNHVAGIGAEAAAAVIWVDTDTRESVVLAYSSESHNSPSFVCAHPGAATGTGGNERDNIALTATKPEAVYESRRQCHPMHNPHNDPVKQHTDETTKGIADYANAMGIPHGDGSIKYHENFSGNNLVNVMTVSIAPKERLTSNKVPITDAPEKYVGIYVGKASDTTGIGGTKFASQAIDMTNQDLNEKAVQDPDPHLQEAVTRGIEKVVDAAIAEGWKHQLSIKDMGAAGLLCSTVEQLHDGIGVVINGDLVPQNTHRNSMELLEAETQERFFIYVHEDYAESVLKIFNEEIGLPHINKGARAAVIGRCNDSGKYIFVRDDVIDVNMPVEEFSAGPLLYKAVKEPERRKHEKHKMNAKNIHAQKTDTQETGTQETCIQETDRKDIIIEEQITAALLSMNFKSDAYVHEHYDKHVRSTNIVNRGEGCATLRTHKLLKNQIGYTAVFDSNCEYGLIDPKFQAEDSFVRAAYKMAAVGCGVIGVTNNANYGRTNIPEEMWEFVKGQEGVARACYNWKLEDSYLKMIAKDPEIAEKLARDSRRHITVNSGNCSLNKANANTGTAIPPTTILGVVGWTDKPDKYATWDLKPEQSKLYLIGARQKRQKECGLFTIDYETAQKEVKAIISAVCAGYVSAANAIEEDGLCNAVAEMVANTDDKIQVIVELDSTMGKENQDYSLNYSEKLFSESYGMIVQVSQEKEQEFAGFIEGVKKYGVDVYQIGKILPALPAEKTLPALSPSEENGTLIFSTEKSSIAFVQNDIKEIYFSKMENMLRETPQKLGCIVGF